jgi:hypothetical protein
MLKATTEAQLFGQGIHEISATPVCNLGTKAVLPDGRAFRYAKAGGTGLEVGKLMQSAAIVPNHQNCAATVAAIGATTVSLTLGNTALTANYYAGGTLTVNAGTGLGQVFTIKSHPAADASAAVVVTLVDPIRVALASSSSKVSLSTNPYDGVIIFPTTPTGAPVGVTPIAVTAAYYFWIQTHGLAACLMDGTPAMSSVLSPSNGTAGAVEGGVITQGAVAMAVGTGVNAEYQPVFLLLD